MFVPGSVQYGRPLARGYDEGRRLSSEAARVWREAIAPFLGVPARVLDLGAGTGRFAGVLTSFAGTSVIAVEPSPDMQAVAISQPNAHAVAHVAGTGEQIPLVDGCCDLAWLSHVWHHVRDRARCVRELRRVVRSGGHVLIRGTFGDRLDGFPDLFRYFPGTRRTCEGLPTIAGTVAMFEGETFTLVSDRRIRQQTCGSLREFADRARLRADSGLVLLPDDEFESGLDRLEKAAAGEQPTTPIVETLELLVFRATQLSATTDV